MPRKAIKSLSWQRSCSSSLARVAEVLVGAGHYRAVPFPPQDSVVHMNSSHLSHNPGDTAGLCLHQWVRMKIPQFLPLKFKMLTWGEVAANRTASPQLWSQPSCGKFWNNTALNPKELEREASRCILPLPSPQFPPEQRVRGGGLASAGREGGSLWGACIQASALVPHAAGAPATLVDSTETGRRPYWEHLCL